MKTEDEIREDFEKSCVLVTKGNTNPFARAKKDRDYLKAGDYILSDARAAWEAWQTCQRVNDAQINQLKNDNKALVLKNAILRQRPDLPVDRIPAHDGIDAKDAEIVRLQGALARAATLIPKEIAYPYDADIFSAYPYCSKEYWEKEKSIMILFKSERDMIAFDYRESPLNYQDMLARGKQLYADIYKKYQVTQALEGARDD